LLIRRIITFNNSSSDASIALLEINQLIMEDNKIEKDKQPAESYIKEIKRNTRSRFSAEEKIRIVMMGIRGEGKVSEICRQFGIVESLYYKWSQDFMEAGKRRLAGDLMREANTTEVKRLRQHLDDYKHMVGEQAHEIRMLKKSLNGNI
jgi:transposase